MMFVDNTIEAKRLGYPCINIGKVSAEAGKEFDTSVLENLGRESLRRTKTSSTAVSKKPKTTLSTIPDLKKVYHTGKLLNLRKLFRKINIAGLCPLSVHLSHNVQRRLQKRKGHQ